MYMNLCMSPVHANIVLSVPLMCTTTVCKRNGREWNESKEKRISILSDRHFFDSQLLTL